MKEEIYIRGFGSGVSYGIDEETKKEIIEQYQRLIDNGKIIEKEITKELAEMQRQLNNLKNNK